MALFLGLASVAHAQSTAPTVSSVAVTSNPGTDNEYATGDTITVTLTFSEAVTVDTTNGTPYVVLDIGGQPRNAAYSGDGSSAAAQPFGYTVLVGDQDADGVSLKANSLALNGGSIQATDDSTDATLTHAAMTFANHNVDTEITLLSNLNQPETADRVTISAAESAELRLDVSAERQFDINAITLDVKAPSDTLNVTVEVASALLGTGTYTYTGSVTAAGLQTFTLSGPPALHFGTAINYGFQPLFTYVRIRGEGAGSIELAGAGRTSDPGGVDGLNFSRRAGPTTPKVGLLGHVGAIPDIVYAEVISSPENGDAYAAGERIDLLVVFTDWVDFPNGTVLPFWLGNGAEHRREAHFVAEAKSILNALYFSYTIQPGDTDTDGIYIGENPLGDNAGIEFRSESNPAIPAHLTLPANQFSSDQSVDGSRSRQCEEVLCSTLFVTAKTVAETDVIGYSQLFPISSIPYVPHGTLSASSFEYGTGEFNLIEITIEKDLLFYVGDPDISEETVNATGLNVNFAPGVPESLTSRLAFSVYDEVLAWDEAAYASRDRGEFTWRYSGPTWTAGDEIDIKLIELATASFDEASYAKTEGDSFDVTVTLDDAFLQTTVTLPITVTANGEATEADYSGIPEDLTFAPGDTEQTFTVTIEDDDVDDDDESLTLSFAEPHIRSGGTNETATITIADNDDPVVEVSFASDTYTAAEGGTATITIELSADPERMLIIPLVKTDQGETTADDYSGVPDEVTFNSGQMSMSFTLTATQDTVDDDDESVRLSFGPMPDARVSPGTTDAATVSITDDDDPFVDVQFNQDSYTAPEGGTVSVSVTLSADPERRVVIPLVKTDQGETTADDYSGVPDEVTFNSGQMSMSFTFTATQDEVDDDDESVLLAFGPMPDARVSPGTTDAATVSIADDDHPFATVMFAQSAYRVVEGGTVTVRVTLSADPERRVVIPLVKTDQGATSADYSGVPSSITINDGETSKTIDFMAAADDEADTGESVRLSFGAGLPSRVTEGDPNEATVTIKQVSTQFALDCAGAIWCADVGFSDQTAEDWGRLHLQAGYGLDPPYSLSDDDFRFRGVDYTVRRIKLQPGTHPVLPNAWSRWHQGYSYFSIHINSGYRGWRPAEAPEEHFRDWVLHLDGVELPFSDAFRYQDEFLWVGVEFQQVFNDWTTSTVTKVGIEEVAAANQDTRPATPWAPMQVDALPAGPNRLKISWTHPGWYYTGLPKPTSYIVQWKGASDSWSESAAVSQREVAYSPGYRNHLLVDGLTDGVFYSVRVIASNAAGDGPRSEETLGRPGDSFPSPVLLAKTVSGQTLTLHFSERLDGNSVPAKTDFTVMVDSGLRGVDSVTISGEDVILTLDRAVSAANAVLVRYDKPADTSAAFLRAVDGNLVQISKLSELLQVVNATPQSSVLPLTAQFTNVPGAHDGSAPFTLNVEFSDSVWIGKGLARDDTLEVTGGTVTVAHWLDRRTDRWAFVIRPETDGDIVITMPGGFCTVNYHDDGVAGAPCAAGDRTLSNRPTVTVPGPSSQQQVVENNPAEGEPRIDGTPEAGQTLLADTSAIADIDGLEEVVFQYQWLADGAEIDGSTGSAYTLTSSDEGRAITVRVDFTDDAGNAESLTSPPAVVTAGLELRSATVDGAVLTLTYNEVLDNLVSVPRTAFAVNVNGVPHSVGGVGFGESNVLLSLSTTVAAGDTVTVDYTAPDGANGIQDTLGRKADSFSGQVVTNNTVPADAGRSVPAEPPGSPDSLEVVRHESGKLRASWDAPDSDPSPTGYTVQWKGTGDDWADEDDVSEANAKGTSHVITGLTDGVEYAVRVIAYNDDAESAPSGEVAATPQETEPPAPSSASVDGATLTITFDEPLDPGETPDRSAFAATVGDASRGVDTVAVSGSIVTLTLVTAVTTGDEVTVGYTAPADASAARLQDLAGNAAAAFSGREVRNDTAPPALTASAHGLPASHDGSASFTFELRFSEEFPTSYETLRDHAFTVTEGDVVNARRLERPGNIRWEITVMPSSDAAVSIVLPITEDCEAEGAICTADGRKLSGRVELVVTNNTAASGAGRSVPAEAPGSPDSLEVVRHESGKLLASWNAPDSGPTPTGYTLQWKQSGDDWADPDKVSETDVTGTSHVITGLTDGVEYAVRVIAYKDDAESAPSGDVTATPQETVPPAPSSASVGGATLTITFDEPLNPGETPDKSVFSVTVGDTARDVETIAVSGSAATVTLVTAVCAGDTVTVDYTAPTDDSAARLQDEVGNVAASFSGLQATNATQAADQPTACAPGSPDSLNVARHESGKLLASWNAPDSGLTPTGYTLQWKQSGDDWADPDKVSETDVTGTSHVITGLTDGVEYAVRVIAYKDDAVSAPSGEVAARPQETVPPAPSSASVGGATLTITFDEPLNPGETPDKSVFSVTVGDTARDVETIAVSGSAVTVTLVTAVCAGDTVTVDYTAPTDESAARLRDEVGNVAASFSGLQATNATQAADQPTACAPGVPAGLEVVRPESGQLLASWDAPDSGLTPTGYTLQWKQSGDDWADPDKVSETDVTGTSHVITGLTDGVEYAVRVIAYKDDAVSAPSGEVAATPQETVPPSPSSASVDGATLTITFDEPLNPGETPDKSAFSVTVGDTARVVDAVAVSGSAATVTLVTAVCAGDTVTVDYTAPTDESAARLRDELGNVAASFSGLQAANAAQAADQFTACVHGVPAAHDGNTTFTFELRFSEEFPISYETLRDHAFTVTEGDVVNARRLERPGNIRWEITVRPSSDAAVTIVLPITEDCEAEGAICTADGRKLSSRLEVTVPGPDG